MKKFAITTAVLASLIGTSAMAAPNYGHNDRNSPRVEQRYDNHQRGKSQHVEQRHDARKPVQRVVYKTWKKGDRFDSRYARNYRAIDARAYGLKNAPSGYRWVQSGDDAVLIGLTSGVVAAVLANIIR